MRSRLWRGCATIGWAWLACAAGASWAREAAWPGDRQCLVTLVEEVEVSARDAGIITEILVRPGREVAAGELLARLDDGDSTGQVEIARKERDIALLQAESVLDIEFAKKSERIAFLELDRAKQANLQARKSVTATELERLRFEWEKTQLQIVQAEHARRRAVLELAVKEERLRVSEEALSKRRLTAPQPGRVVDVYRHVGEWVNPGDPVLRIVRLDRLRVKAYLDAQMYHPAQLREGRARVRANLLGGREETLPGQVVFVSPEVDADGRFAVWIEVRNRQEQDVWLLSPGNKADVVIEIPDAALP